jgi:hypothetical protein
VTDAAFDAPMQASVQLNEIQSILGIAKRPVK